MSLVSNFIGGISPIQNQNGANVTSAYDINDTTFSDLLEKQMNTKSVNEVSIVNLQLGMPAGLEIENINLQTESDRENITLTDIGIESQYQNNPNTDVTNSEMVTFFSSLLNQNFSETHQHSEIFDFAKKHAAGLYNKYSKNVITDVQEFVSDIKNMVS